MTKPIVFISLVVVGILLGSLLPITVRYDKVFHIGTYCFLLLSLCCLFPKYVREWFILVIFAGVGMEVLQELTGWRTFSYGDIAANVTGTYLGILCLFVKEKLYVR